MTKRQSEILAKLAAHGRPQMWADEGETAVLSGMSLPTFRSKVRELEATGFPKQNALNGKRSIPAILRFWGHAGDPEATPETLGNPERRREIEDIRERLRENWGDASEKKFRTEWQWIMDDKLADEYARTGKKPK